MVKAARKQHSIGGKQPVVTQEDHETSGAALLSNLPDNVWSEGVAEDAEEEKEEVDEEEEVVEVVAEEEVEEEAEVEVEVEVVAEEKVEEEAEVAEEAVRSPEERQLAFFKRLRKVLRLQLAGDVRIYALRDWKRSKALATESGLLAARQQEMADFVAMG
jgi:hypothetical protein